MPVNHIENYCYVYHKISMIKQNQYNIVKFKNKIKKKETVVYVHLLAAILTQPFSLYIFNFTLTK